MSYSPFVVGRARSDPAFFAGLLGRDETTGQPIALAPFHHELESFWSSEPRSVVWAPPEHGKTSLAALRVAWELGLDPSLRVHWVSNTATAAERNTTAVLRVIDSDPFRMIFPQVKIDRAWAGGFSLAGRPGSAKDPTLSPVGFGNASVLGARCNLLIGDDLIGLDDIMTPLGRDRAWATWSTVHLSRLAPAGRAWLLGTAWHSDDLLHRASRLPGWASKSFPICDPSTGAPLWPARWTPSRIAERRAELGPVRSSTLLDNVPIDEAAQIFTFEMVEQALRLGSNPHLTPAGCRCVVGCDPAWTTGTRSDESGVVMVATDGEFRYLSFVQGLKVRHDSLANRVVELARTNRATCYVESNGAGQVIADHIGRRAPCKTLHTNPTSKRARVEALSAELASGRWIFCQPLGSPSEELKKLCAELLTFSFDQHAGDRASALLLACEGVRELESRPKARAFHLDLLRR